MSRTKRNGVEGPVLAGCSGRRTIDPRRRGRVRARQKRGLPQAPQSSRLYAPSVLDRRCYINCLGPAQL
jgi:hypothetical protein